MNDERFQLLMISVFLADAVASFQNLCGIVFDPWQHFQSVRWLLLTISLATFFFCIWASWAQYGKWKLYRIRKVTEALTQGERRAPLS